MKLSQKGIDLIKEFEGWSATSYPDASGRSIGYGHFILPGEHFNEPIDKFFGETLLRKDVEFFERVVAHAVRVDLLQNQFNALVSLVYNIGESAFRGSTLLRKLNDRDYMGAAKEFGRWIYSQGKVNDALVKRRAKEAALFQMEEKDELD